MTFAVFMVRLLAWEDQELWRYVTVCEPLAPTVNEQLEQIYRYGQNDVQPQPGLRSVGPGDVILHSRGTFFILQTDNGHAFERELEHRVEEYSKLLPARFRRKLLRMGLGGMPAVQTVGQQEGGL